ncbi:unannotated protein [freshwater metagenome]|uniref:Unannotated protein n=1 Tax=freshwater metagenome TaxID=449393 RepID=A0A6J6TRM1_9ZZZZ
MGVLKMGVLGMADLPRTAPPARFLKNSGYPEISSPKFGRVELSLAPPHI